ncbi:MAG: Na+/H+ antiporter NhaC family protein [Ignavibacteriales bacterium]|nr:Na+/H+ antiporter NhaC family protein [Ignavibacteriales bacterium]
MDFGILSLLPPFVAILLCFLTKRVLLSLFIGIFIGSLIIVSGNPFSAVEYSLDAIIGSMADEWNSRLLLFNLFMGSGVAFIWRLGGSKALSNWASKKIKTKRQAGLGAWFLGFIIFFNDGVNAAIVGNVFRDIFTAKKISREKLSYIVDSTAAPISTFLISDWIAFQIGMIHTGISAAGIEGVSAFTGYLQSIPLNIYAILAVVMVGIIIITKKDYGPMYNAEKRTELTGKVMRDGAIPLMDVAKELGTENELKPMLRTVFLPILTLTIVTLLGFAITGKDGTNIIEVLEKADPAKALLWGAFSMMIVGVIIALSYRIMNIKEVMETILDGMKLMLLACAILVLAWSLGAITKDMFLADYLIKIIGDSIEYKFLPVIIFILGAIISFATGTSWGTMTILTPIAIPLAYKLTGDPTTSIIIAGVVFSGAIFGDHCSPISDTTVLSSIFSGSDHMDHVNTQIPYALTAALITSLLYLLWGFYNFSYYVLYILGFSLLLFLIFIFNLIYSKKTISNNIY